MADSDNFVKGHWVKHFPKSLKESIDGLTEIQELMVFRTFLYNGLYGKAVPLEQRERVFSRIESAHKNIQFLLRTKIFSKDENEGVFLDFALEEFQVANDQIRRRKEAGRRGGLKSSRNKISTIVEAKPNKDKDKDKDKDNDSSIISLSKDNSSFSQAKSDIVSGKSDDFQDGKDLATADDTGLHEVKLVEPELIGNETKGISPPRKPTTSQNKAVVEAVVAGWNQMATDAALPKVRAVTPDRSQKLINTIKKLDLTLDQVLAVIDTIPKSNFLSGRSTDFKATFAWFIKTENLNKIIDGNYHDEKSNRKTPGDRVKDEFLRYIDDQEQADGQGD